MCYGFVVNLSKQQQKIKSKEKFHIQRTFIPGMENKNKWTNNCKTIS